MLKYTCMFRLKRCLGLLRVVEDGQNSQQMARKSERDTQWQNKRVRNSWWVHGQNSQGTNGHQNKQKSGQSECHTATWLLEFKTHRLHLMDLQNGTWTVTSFSSCHPPKCPFLSNFSTAMATDLCLKMYYKRTDALLCWHIVIGPYIATRFRWIIVWWIHLYRTTTACTLSHSALKSMNLEACFLCFANFERLNLPRWKNIR